MWSILFVTVRKNFIIIFCVLGLRSINYCCSVCGCQPSCTIWGLWWLRRPQRRHWQQLCWAWWLRRPWRLRQLWWSWSTWWHRKLLWLNVETSQSWFCGCDEWSNHEHDGHWIALFCFNKIISTYINVLLYQLYVWLPGTMGYSGCCRKVIVDTLKLRKMAFIKEAADSNTFDSYILVSLKFIPVEP